MSNEDEILEQLRRPQVPSMPRNVWDEVLPGLFQGGTLNEDTINGPRRQAKSSVTVDDFDSVFTLYQYANPVDWFVKEYRYGVFDHDMEDFDPVSDLLEMVRIAHTDWTNGKRVLIRCQAGLNRSGLVMALVLIREGMEAQDAIDLIRKSRSEHCLFNPHFVKFLLSTDPAVWRS